MLISRKLLSEYQGTRNKTYGRIRSTIPLITLLTGFLFIFLSSNTVRAEQAVRVGVYQNSPKVSISESGRAEGIFIDIIEAIAEEEGWSLKYVRGTWSEGLDRLEKGEIDLMPDVGYSKLREETFSLNREPVLSDWFQIYTRRGSGIRSLIDLDGKHIAVLERSVQQDIFEQFHSGFDITVSIISFKNFEDAFNSVKQGDADAVISNRFYGTLNAGRYGLEDTAVIFNPNRLFFAAPKGKSAQLLKAIDKHLVQFKKNSNSVYYRSLRRWTSEEVIPVFPIWLKGVGIFLAGIILLGFLWNRSLKRQVRSRTRLLDLSNQETTYLYKELQKYAETLEKRVEERTEELSKTNSELIKARDAAEAADRTKLAFLASMSHELRTPLNSIIGFTGLLLQGMAGPLNEEQNKQLRMVKNSGQHLLSLINDVLDISKIEAGQIDVANETFDIPESVQRVVQMVRLLAESKRLLLTLNIAPDVSRITSDRRRFEQILMNLMSNAIKFTDEGKVHVDASAEKGELIIRVTDTGIGIKPEDKDKLFQPFRQLDTGLTRQHEGTGLGLSICKRLAERLGGSITVESEWGKGSVFQLTLPLFPERKP
ncbi:MAG: transporter substrate-binding domain-containing protein [Candidatus Omnitrophica bacterium]|nr:transporter substrate-binding domain-containing protein [Candidatus Omnitrophota bacterium]